MRIKWKLGMVVCLCLLLLEGCSTSELDLISKDSATSINKTLVVLRINWQETYNDTKLKEDNIMTGAGLLNLKEVIDNNRVVPGKPELYRALYYLSKFKFEFEHEDGSDPYFIRFGKDLRQYESLGIYQFTPGKIALKNVFTEQKRFKEGRNGNMDVYWYKYTVDYPEDYGFWDLPQGKIVYLGDFTMFFKTKRFIEGLIYPEEVNKSIVLERVVVEDHFDAVKEELSQKKDWFPAENLLNLSNPKEWVYIQASEEKKVETQSPKKKDPNAFF